MKVQHFLALGRSVFLDELISRVGGSGSEHLWASTVMEFSRLRAYLVVRCDARLLEGMEGCFSPSFHIFSFLLLLLSHISILLIHPSLSSL